MRRHYGVAAYGRRNCTERRGAVTDYRGKAREKRAEKCVPTLSSSSYHFDPMNNLAPSRAAFSASSG
jgi:hypothetical protein